MTGINNGDARVAIVLNRDLLFGSRIRVALTALGLEPHFVKDSKEFVAALDADQSSVAIGIVDMNGSVDWDVLRQSLLNREPPQAPTLAFGPHTDAENRRKAKSAGVTRIVSNGQFHSDMAALIDRYRKH